MSDHPIIGGLEIRGPLDPVHAEILTPAACAFLAVLAAKFEPRRRELLAQRAARQLALAAGQLPDFLPATAALRAEYGAARYDSGHFPAYELLP